MEVQMFKVSNNPIMGDKLVNQCYLLKEGSSGILIDPAWDYRQINQFVLHHEITLKGVLLTHGHEDHTNLAEKFAKAYHIPVFMSEIEIREAKFKCKNLRMVNHLEDLNLYPFNITPILTPGHTAGSMCYLVEDHLFSGDTVFIEGVGLCVDANKMYDSVQFLKNYLALDVRFWPGHSYGFPPGKTLEFLLKNNIYLALQSRENFIKFRMRTSSNYKQGKEI